MSKKITPGAVREISAGIYQLQMPLAIELMSDLDHVNIYLIKGTAGWILIDSGWYTPDAQTVFEAALKSLKLTYTDISTIIISHSHPDHFGMAGRIKHNSPRTRMLMHSWEADLIESRYLKFLEPQRKMSVLLKSHGVPETELDALGTAAMPVLEFVTVTLPDDVLYGGEILHTGTYDLEVIWTPGHSPGHICLYEPQNQILFCGDLILPSITPNVSYNILSGDNPLGDYISSLNKLTNIPIKEAHPGHEHSFTDFKNRVKAIFEHHRQREEEILKLMNGRACDSYQVASGLTWNVPGISWTNFPPAHKRMAIGEVIAHIEHLRWEGRLTKIIRDNRVFYSPVGD